MFDPPDILGAASKRGGKGEEKGVEGCERKEGNGGRKEETGGEGKVESFPVLGPLSPPPIDPTVSSVFIRWVVFAVMSVTDKCVIGHIISCTDNRVRETTINPLKGRGFNWLHFAIRI